MPKVLPRDLADLQGVVDEAARVEGLNGFRTIYEVLDFDEMNMVAAFGGFPVRYPHWKWGMEYERLSKTYEYGLSKIYEMVINNDPCYAYLLESNSFVDQKLVMCHVAGHSDFFKNNYAFQYTNRRMIDEMANHATRVRRYADWYGVDEVENFIDKVLCLENLIDRHAPYIVRTRKDRDTDEGERAAKVDSVRRMPTDKEYMERYVNPDQYMESERERVQKEEKKQKTFPAEPARDVLQFLVGYAPLKRWQRDILEILRDEFYYFAPQAMTKIMNEGWASYWHAHLMTKKLMLPSELLDFADRHSGVVAQTGKSLNPYKLGVELFRDIEERWNRGCFGPEWEHCSNMAEKQAWDKKLGQGRQKIFDVRKHYSDVTFIDEFFTLDFCKRNGFFTYGFDKKKQDFVIESREFKEVKKKLLASLTNSGSPVICVTDGNFENRAELLLEHRHDGVDLDFAYARDTLRNLQYIWTRPVHLLTHFEERQVMLSFDGEALKERPVGRQV